jgi:hemerythrin-like domain-containing protein
MIQTLPGVAHDHHDRLTRHIDRLPAMGDLIGSIPAAELRPQVDEAATFLTETLIPHMETAERTLYPELERLLQNRHSMSPMRREHAEIRQLVADFERIQGGLDRGHLSTGDAVALRRVVFRLYALMKIHLAEEQLYVGILDHGVSTEAAEALAAAMEHAGAAND